MANKNAKTAKNPKTSQNIKSKVIPKINPFLTETTQKVNPFQTKESVKKNQFHKKARKSILSTANSVGSVPNKANASTKSAEGAARKHVKRSVIECAIIVMIILGKQNSQEHKIEVVGGQRKVTRTFRK